MHLYYTLLFPNKASQGEGLVFQGNQHFVYLFFFVANG